MTGTASEQRRKKHSKNNEANEIIELLRKAAMMVRDLGDELEAVRVRVASLEHQGANFEEYIARTETHEEEFEQWHELLLNFRSGIADADELLAGTVGRS
jgi:hypothetical protein